MTWLSLLKRLSYNLRFRQLYRVSLSQMKSTYTSNVNKLKKFMALLLDGLKTLLEDANIIGVKISAQDIEKFNNLGLKTGRIFRRIILVDKAKLIDPLGVPFFDSNQTFNNFCFSTFDENLILESMQKFYSNSNKKRLNEIWKNNGVEFKFPSSYYVYGMPWVRFVNYKNYNLDASFNESKGNHYWGPLEPDEIKSEMNRFLNLYKSFAIKERLISKIKRNLLPKHRFISGFFLTEETGEYLFMVLSGKHRAHVIQNLPFTKIRVRIDPNFYPIVDKYFIKDDTLEGIGMYAPGLIERIRNAVFTATRSS